MLSARLTKVISENLIKLCSVYVTNEELTVETFRSFRQHKSDPDSNKLEVCLTDFREAKHKRQQSSSRNWLKDAMVPLPQEHADKQAAADYWAAHQHNHPG